MGNKNQFYAIQLAGSSAGFTELLCLYCYGYCFLLVLALPLLLLSSLLNHRTMSKAVICFVFHTFHCAMTATTAKAFFFHEFFLRFFSTFCSDHRLSPYPFWPSSVLQLLFGFFGCRPFSLSTTVGIFSNRPRCVHLQLLGHTAEVSNLFTCIINSSKYIFFSGVIRHHSSGVHSKRFSLFKNKFSIHS